MPNYTERNLRLLPPDFTIAWRNLHEKWQEINLRLLDESPESEEYHSFRHIIGIVIMSISSALSYDWDSKFQCIVNVDEELKRIDDLDERLSIEADSFETLEEAIKVQRVKSIKINQEYAVVLAAKKGSSMFQVCGKLASDVKDRLENGTDGKKYPKSIGLISELFVNIATELEKLQVQTRQRG